MGRKGFSHMAFDLDKRSAARSATRQWRSAGRWILLSESKHDPAMIVGSARQRHCNAPSRSDGVGHMFVTKIIVLQSLREAGGHEE